MVEPYTAERQRLSLARQAKCLAFAAKRDPQGWDYLDWLIKYSDIPAFAEKGMADPMKWLDLYDAFVDAAETLKLLSQLAALRDDATVMAWLRKAVEAEAARQAGAAATGTMA